MIASNNSCRAITANNPNSPPSGSEPVSPMKTDAGWQLNHRKPSKLPIVAAATTSISPAPATCGDSK